MVVDIGQVRQQIKPKADSTLYNMRKKDLISYVRTLEHNYNVAVSFNENQARYIESLGVTVKQWIPVTERLPEKEGSYLVCSKTGKVYTSHYYTEKKCSGGYIRKPAWSHPNITHWMPLPEPPKEEA